MLAEHLKRTMTTVEFEKQSNRQQFGINPNLHSKDELATIDMVLKVAQGLYLLKQTLTDKGRIKMYG